MNQAADSTPLQPGAAVGTTIRALRFDGADVRLETNHALPEPAPGEAVIRTTKVDVSATDLDLPGDTLTYAITAGDPNGGFAIDASGNITIADASVLDLDFDDGTDLVATLTVQVSDGALTDTVDVTVRVTPINDNTPSAGADFTTTLAEESANGAAVGTVSAADLDLPGDTLSYAITAGNVGGAFAIDASGVVTVAGALDFEGLASYALTVEVTDSGQLSDTATVTITAEDAAAMESGELNPMEAFMAGRIQVAGDMTLMMQMQAISMQAAAQAAQASGGDS